MSSEAPRPGTEHRRVATPGPDTTVDLPRTAGPTSERAELLRRRAEVQALRRTVERERRRRQQVVERYETLLDERTGETASADPARDPAGLAGALAALARRLTGRRR